MFLFPLQEELLTISVITQLLSMFPLFPSGWPEMGEKQEEKEARLGPSRPAPCSVAALGLCQGRRRSPVSTRHWPRRRPRAAWPGSLPVGAAGARETKPLLCFGSGKKLDLNRLWNELRVDCWQSSLAIAVLPSQKKEARTD